MKKNIVSLFAKLSSLLVLFYFISTSIASAQSGGTRLTDIDSIAKTTTNIGNLVIELAIGVAVIWIIINTIRYFIVESEGGKGEAGMMVLWGVVALFVILSIWGLVAILKSSFVTNDNRPTSDINRLKFADPTTGSLPGGAGNNTSGSLYNGSDSSCINEGC